MNLLLQKILPQFFVTWLIGQLAHCQARWFKNLFIKGFIRYHRVDMQLAVEPDYRAYASFSDFFTRAIKLEQRPITAGELDLASPVDGTTSEFGTIEEGKLIQAKGLDYELSELVGDWRLSQQFCNGNFATFYLSPKDYHRVHMPFAGTLRTMIHIPGKLYSVNPSVTSVIPKIYAGNERVVFHFESELGAFLVIMVGAMGVGSIGSSWAGKITNHGAQASASIDYPASGAHARHFAKGSELGYFDMGSTVILAMPQGSFAWDEGLAVEKPVIMGEKIGAFA